jgi:putative ABC transport system substrate-binding protein
MQFAQLKRREFITLVGGAAAWPFAARAQQAAMPVVGMLEAGNIGANPSVLPAFRKGLSEVGYIDGQTVAIEYRAAEGYYDRLPELAADLLRRRAAVIVTPLSVAATLAAKAVTTTVPIVFSTGSQTCKRPHQPWDGKSTC